MALRSREMLDVQAQESALQHAPPDPPSEPPGRNIPIFCGLVIAGCVAMFLLDRFLVRPAPGTDGEAIQIGALFGPAVAGGEWWRLLTNVFEHGGIVHLAMNMSVVYTLGFPLERRIGAVRMAVISFVTALGSSTLVILFAGELPTVGASGMILGWVGALLPIASAGVRRNLLVWLAQIVVISLLPFVSWQGHLGGFLFGLVCGLALRLGPERFRVFALPLMGAAAGAAYFAVQYAAPGWH